MMIQVKVGDKVRRNMGGVLMTLEVINIDVTEDLIETYGGWVFDRQTGAEIDELLGWGPKYGVSGSFIEAA